MESECEPKPYEASFVDGPRSRCLCSLEWGDSEWRQNDLIYNWSWFHCIALLSLSLSFSFSFSHTYILSFALLSHTHTHTQPHSQMHTHTHKHTCTHTRTCVAFLRPHLPSLSHSGFQEKMF